jgi:hypothetical protein
MFKYFIIALFIFSCQLPNNPLSPKGPFGIFTLFFNLSKVGNFEYDKAILYLPVNESILETIINHSLKLNPFISTDFITDKALPAGYQLDAKTGQIILTTIFPTESEFTSYKIFANNFFNKGQYFGEFSTRVKNLSFGCALNVTNLNIPQPFDLTQIGINYTYSNFSITPELPTGLTLNQSTGSITGNCQSLYSKKFHFLRSTRSDGKTVFALISFWIYEWYSEAYLKAPNAGNDDRFGQSVSISGETIVVGARFEDSNQLTITNGATASSDNTAGNSGAAYVFRRTDSTWINEAYLKAPNAEGGDFFANSISISDDTIVVGAYFEASNQATITNGTTASTNNSALDAGAAYVFKRNGTTWSNEAYLKAPNTEGSDNFGISISISGDTIVAGANGESSNQTTITNGLAPVGVNGTPGAGAAYVFRRTGSTWTNEAYLKAPNAEASDQFGISVSISGDTIVVGALDEDSNQTTITNGTTASNDNSAGTSGAAYVFRRNGTTWTNEAYLKAPNSESFDSFGQSVSISGDTIVVGARSEDSNQTTITNGTIQVNGTGANDSGAAYVFRRTGNIWSNEAYLKAPNAETLDNFGISVSISGDIIVVGANFEDSNQTTITNGAITGQTSDTANNLGVGAAYVFRRSGNLWTSDAYLKAPNAGGNMPNIGDMFGESVSISGDTIVVGANGEDSNQTTITNGTTASFDNSVSNSGAAYVFRRK